MFLQLFLLKDAAMVDDGDAGRWHGRGGRRRFSMTFDTSPMS
jgi:hypothetical protein